MKKEQNYWIPFVGLIFMVIAIGFSIMAYSNTEAKTPAPSPTPAETIHTVEVVENGFDFKTPALYFFSAVAQTMGALLAITFTVFYISIQNFYKRDFQIIDKETEDDKARRFLREVVALEPLKRIMINDMYLKWGYLSGIGTVIISIIGLVILYFTGMNNHIAYIIMFILAPVVVAGVVASIFSTLHFVKNKFGQYSNPTIYILQNRFSGKLFQIQIDKRNFKDEFEILIYTNIIKDTDQKIRYTLGYFNDIMHNYKQTVALIAKDITTDIRNRTIEKKLYDTSFKIITNQIFVDVHEHFNKHTKKVVVAAATELLTHICEYSAPYSQETKRLYQIIKGIEIEMLKKADKEILPYPLFFHLSFAARYRAFGIGRYYNPIELMERLVTLLQENIITQYPDDKEAIKILYTAVRVFGIEYLRDTRKIIRNMLSSYRKEDIHDLSNGIMHNITKDNIPAFIKLYNMINLIKKKLNMTHVPNSGLLSLVRMISLEIPLHTGFEKYILSLLLSFITATYYIISEKRVITNYTFSSNSDLNLSEIREYNPRYMKWIYNELLEHVKAMN